MNNKPSDQAAQIIAALAERWPQCFTISKAERRPLKIGVARDIIAAGGITRGDIGRALRSYTSVEGYLESCKAGAARIDLDGNVAGSVSELMRCVPNNRWQRGSANAKHHVGSRLQICALRLVRVGRL